MNISVICVYNNEKQVKEQLLHSLKNQTVKHEMISIDNTSNRFRSAAVALNYGVGIATGDLLIFAHQDIYLKTNFELEIFAECIASLEEGTIVGTQGAVYPSRNHISNLTSGEVIDKSLVYTYQDALYEVDCVDEGFFGLKRETWNHHKFNEVICDNWHLYCVEMCMNAHRNNNKVYVSPIQLHHFSKGTISIEYMKGMKMLCKNYRKNSKYIWTTCYKVYTNAFYIQVLFYAWCANRMIRRKTLGKENG